MYSLLLALCCALSFSNAFPFMVEENGTLSLLRQFFMRFPRSQMGPCTIAVRNQAEVPLVFLGSYGDHWEEGPQKGIVLRPGESSNNTFQLGVPGIFEFAHWGWLYFSYDIPSIGPKTFLVYAEVSATGAYDSLGAGPFVDLSLSTRENPYPQGRFGMSNIDQAVNEMEITIFDKDLWSAELSPENWMDDLSKLRPAVLDWPLSRFKYPGQHDAGSFGNKEYSNYILAWSWQCTDKNLYDQARSGIRWFDLRLSKRGGMYWPFHGLSDKTGDPLVWNAETNPSVAASDSSLVGQILNFLNEQPNEIMIIQVKFKHGTSVAEFWRIISQYLGDRLIKPPEDLKVPTLRSVQGTERRIILFSNLRRWPPGDENELIMDYIWDYTNRTFWRGGPWNQNDWDKHDMERVAEKTETWMRSHINSSTSHIFWTAQCALTPSFMNKDYLLYPSSSPKALAKDANPFTRERITNRELYQQNATVISTDWASSEDNIAIAAMNFEKADIGLWHSIYANKTSYGNDSTSHSEELMAKVPEDLERAFSKQKPLRKSTEDSSLPAYIDLSSYQPEVSTEDQKVLV